MTKNDKQSFKWMVIVTLLMSGIFLFGCSQDKNPQQTVSQNQEEDMQTTTEAAITEDEAKEDLTNKVKSPLTGLYIEKDQLNDRVIAVMLDNQYSARPQAGITQFDIVYEILAEGNITRYMGILGTGRPDNIGPIRSSRDYFIERALEYDALYVHVGGSPQAYKAISNLKVASVDAMHQSSDIFWRKHHKSAPHNMYSDYKAIIKGAERKGYRESGDYEQLSFSEEDEIQINGEALDYIQFPYNGKKYYSSYEYNKDEKLYYRSINGKPQLDEENQVPVATKNIIVQFTNTRSIKGDTEGRLAMDMVGEGKGFYITDGKYIAITWKKSDIYSLTRYYDSSGEAIALNPGNIWIQVYPAHRSEELIINEMNDI